MLHPPGWKAGFLVLKPGATKIFILTFSFGKVTVKAFGLMSKSVIIV